VELSDSDISDSPWQAVYSDPGTHDLQLLRNRIHDTGSDGTHLTHGLYLEGDGHLVASNVVSDVHGGYCIQRYPEGDGGIIANNTLVNCASGGLVVGGEGSHQLNGALIVNNIVAFNQGYGIYGYGGDGSGNVARNNLEYGNQAGADVFSEGVLSILTNLIANPLFVDRAAHDYRLAAGSRAIGTSDPAYTLSTDTAGAPRSATPNLGAY
jgi:hypothetical protein